MLIHGTKDNLIENVSFEKVSVELLKTSKWPCGMYDLRPCIDFGIEKDFNSCFYLRNAEAVSFVNCKASVNGESEYYRHAVDSENVNGLGFEKFSAKGISEGTDEMKIR